MEVLRSSFTAGGERVYLLFQPTTRRFRLATRWCYVAIFLQLQDATDAFEALELSDRPAAQLGRLLIQAVRKTPRSIPGSRPHAMWRINRILDFIDARASGTAR
ncbi:hypothetical protein ABIC11_004381 [Pseudomonas oryzihabitans]